MKGKVLAGFIAVVGAQLLLLLGMIGFNENTLRTGTSVVLQTVPIDPRSLLQGDYVILGYKIDRVPVYLENVPPGTRVYVTLVEGPEVWEAGSYLLDRPSSGTFITGTTGTLGSNRRLDFGIGNYFVPEGTGRVIEQAMRSQDPLAVKVRVAVDSNGNAKIQELLVNGKPFDPKELPAPTPPVRTIPPQPEPTPPQPAR